MAHLLRLILAAVLAVFSVSVHALIPVSDSWSFNAAQYGDSGKQGSGFASAQAACDAYVNAQKASIPSWTFGSGAVGAAASPASIWGDFKCTVYANNGSIGPMQAGLYKSAGGSCPANSTLVSSLNQCSCNANYEEDSTHTSCVPSKSRWEKACEGNIGKRYNFQSAGKNQAGGCQTEINNVNSPIEGDTGGLPDSFGCQVRFVDDGSKTSALDPDTKEWVTKGLGRVTGETCVGTGVPVPSDAPEGTTQESEGKNDQCPYGLVKGVNGQIVCAYSDPNGTIEGTETSTVKNPDGTSTDTKKEIKCDGGVCTTTTTTTTRDSAGTIVGTKIDEKKESIGETCNKDPGNKVCATTGGGGSDGGAGFSGTCEAGFQAKGEDPVLNAMALEQYKRNCETFRTDMEPSTWVVAEGQKTGNAMEGNPNNGSVSVGPGNFDQSDALGGGGCNLNKTVVVRGYSVALPFNVLCDPLAVLGQILVAVSLLLAARIVTRG
ncbi:hypothetical protein QMO14_23140 [Variovorax sp. CAN2819]|uniref:hypothetical protein n=1 Tax=Variovorax sp. CAN15 TaxID=3046727 RepID=UPI0026474105|nr:hypothetical protein [Variovorax sp. CAN15]MDN6886491.1 hypothetical protein [Variovorax sp. CAN15]